MLSLKDFEEVTLLNDSKLVVGGWAEIIETPTGNIVHEIDCDGNEAWSLGNTTYVGSNPTDFAKNGDHG